MGREGGHSPWCLRALRSALVAAIAALLWACAIAGPFIAAHLVVLHDRGEQLRTAGALVISVAGVLAFLCYLTDRI
ncbi:MAG: hypothetical protein NT045_03375 [Candidatus Aureabacteria bacterium]|nr:hypothetical protein [Candidatus Auribacterota bacterium]